LMFFEIRSSFNLIPLELNHTYIVFMNGNKSNHTKVQLFNVEVTGAARLYRAASVWTAGLALFFP